MTHSPQRWEALALGMVLLAANGLRAEGINWHHDPAAARQQASKVGRPILFDFGTETCFWCKKLDVTTFRVAAVADLVNERFIAVKIDADREPGLTKQLGVEQFPTLVVVGPDGEVLGRHEGYAEAPKMTAFLHQALQKMPAPHKPIQEPPAPQVASPNAEKQARARELLRLARQDYEERCYMACLERCRLVTSSYGYLEEAEEARQLAQRITGDHATWQRTCARLSDSLGELYLKEAQTLLAAGKVEEGRGYLDRVLQVCPHSAWACKAAALLETIHSKDVRGNAPAPVCKGQNQ
jgi:thioredoxin-related protein